MQKRNHIKNNLFPILIFLIIYIFVGKVYAQQIDASDFVQYSQDSSFVLEYNVPVKDFGLKGITVDDLGNVWLYHSNNVSSKIFKFEKDSQYFTEYEIPHETETTDVIINLAGGHLTYRNNILWFTDARTNSIGKLDPNTNEIELYKIPTKDSGPFGLSFEPHTQRLWFTELSASKLGVLDVLSKQITEYSLKENSGPAFIDFDKSGMMWVTQSYSNSIIQTNPQRLTSNELNFREYMLPNPDSFSPFGIAIFEAPDGKERIALSDHGSNRVIMSLLDAKLESYTSFWTSPSPVYPQTLPSQVVADKSGNVYFAQHGGNRISKIDTNNTVTEIDIPTGPLSTTLYLAVYDGKVWFSEVLANKIGFIDFNQEMPLTVELSKNYITVGVDDSLDVFVSGKKSDLVAVDDISISLVGMKPAGIHGIHYSVVSDKIDVSDSTTKSKLKFTLQKNLVPGFYDLMVRVSALDIINRNMTVSILKPISLAVNDLEGTDIPEKQNEISNDNGISFESTRNILVIVLVVIGLLLLYRRIRLKKNHVTV